MKLGAKGNLVGFQKRVLKVHLPLPDRTHVAGPLQGVWAIGKYSEHHSPCYVETREGADQ